MFRSLPVIMSSVNLLLRDLGYNALSTIGEGAYSKVKLATSSKYHCNVAIKVLDHRLASADFSRKFLPRELDILRGVHHPHVISVFELIEINNGLRFIVMELCRTDLLQLIQKTGRLPDEKAKCLFQQMISGMSYLHEHNVVHRDLKCENVLLTNDHCVKITDFGFGKKCFDETDLCTTYCGSPAYASPEVLQCIPYDPKKYDIWSLGVILYVMVTGLMPFSDCKLSSLLKLQQMGVVFPESVALDEKCKSLIKQMLHYNPHARPDLCTVLKQGWIGDK
ncbi:testis-specific serine/threonine-protein kinase 6 [Mixophyes fleayi]|uniref:testis-specific serine/threonine-protein kinase 6 n=1 Tax=Mixophyes fleayi TaxID=3061075 RepID=UPI003F4DA4DB